MMDPLRLTLAVLQGHGSVAEQLVKAGARANGETFVVY